MSPIPTLSSLSATTITLYLAISVAHHTRSPTQEAGPARPTRPTQGRLSQHRPGPASSLASPELAPSEAAAAIAAGAAEAAGAG